MKIRKLFNSVTLLAGLVYVPIGMQAQNTSYGSGALPSGSGSQNAAFGAFAIGLNQTGSQNSALGFNSMYANTNGTFNTCIGYAAGYNAYSGLRNTAVGALALWGNTASNNIGIGADAGGNIITGEFNICIGNSGLTSDSGIIRIGTPGYQSETFIAGISGATAASGVAVYVNASGQLGTLTSSAKFKRDIENMDDASSKILSLHPVSFRYKSELDPYGLPQFGLIAEEVEKVDPDLVARDDKNQIYTVRYQAVDAMLLNEFLKEHRVVVQQESEIVSLKERVDKMDKLEKELSDLKHTLELFQAKK